MSGDDLARRRAPRGMRGLADARPPMARKAGAACPSARSGAELDAKRATPTDVRSPAEKGGASFFGAVRLPVLPVLPAESVDGCAARGSSAGEGASSRVGADRDGMGGLALTADSAVAVAGVVTRRCTERGWRCLDAECGAASAPLAAPPATAALRDGDPLRAVRFFGAPCRTGPHGCWNAEGGGAGQPSERLTARTLAGAGLPPRPRRVRGRHRCWRVRMVGPPTPAPGCRRAPPWTFSSCRADLAA